MLTLYDKAECPFCYRVRLCLGHLGLGVVRYPHDDPEHERAWRALTSAKTVPVLVDGDVVLTDSQVILEYLQDLHGGLLPDGAAARAHAREVTRFADNPVGRAVREVVFEKRAKPEGPWDEERLRAARVAWLETLPTLEAWIEGRDHFAGVYSFADAALTGRFALALAYGLELPPGYVALRRWLEARLADPFFVDASPPRVRAWSARERA